MTKPGAWPCRRFPRLVGLAAVTALCHLLLLAALLREAVPQAASAPPIPIEVELVRPAPPLPPPTPTPDSTTGGGAPATPSRIHTPPEPPPDVPTSPVSPPREPAPEPALQIGVAPDQTGEGRGQGGEGPGTGSGVGLGDGMGAGSSPPRLIRAPERAELRALHPPQALRARQGGMASIRCRIRSDGTLEACEAVRETPAGQGFAAAAVRSAPYFRFEPPRVDGRPVGGQAVTLRVEFMVR